KQGASGIGMLRGSEEKAEEIFNQIKGKKVSEVFSVDSGVTDLSQVFDIPLHDLTGVILKKPVYQLLGQESPIITKCYSGMVYMDDVDIKDNRKAFDKILEECFYDYNRGYRQFKLKIGRGFKWMPAEEGLKRDVEITHMVNRYFPDVDILVDANDGYTVKNFIRYLEQLEDISIWWIEEPFRETVDDFTVLRKWLNDNRKRNTLLADGEARPDLNLALEMGKKQVLDVYLDDIMGYGFTNWRKLMPRLIENGLQASPHNWGDYLKTIYTGHLAGGIGNVVTNEGVTCFSSDIDFGFNRVENGVFIPSSSPGFGVTLLK
ncbi:MAG: enolase C-terminal domain-like protein, partial [Proteiniphilum sp.]|nr:enolase C-terminal domain-like protein [Proteiniphilum sp.]